MDYLDSLKLFQSLQAALKAIEEYQSKNAGEVTGLWANDVKGILPELLKKGMVLGAAGKPCSRCGGSGRES